MTNKTPQGFRSTLKTLPRRKVEAAQEVLNVLAASLGPEPDEE